MSHMLSLLNEMRGRLSMYVGETSLSKLAAYLRGYEYAAERLGGCEEDAFLAEFRDWLHRRFQSTMSSWEGTILRRSANEAEAVDQFWALLDEYLKERPDGVTPATFPSVNTPAATPACPSNP